MTLLNGKVPKQKLIGTKDTLVKIREMISTETPGILQRFGDGDVRLALGSFDMLQKSDARLSSLMKAAFALSGPGIMKCAPLHCKEWDSFEEGMFPGNHEGNEPWCSGMLKNFLALCPEANQEDFPIYSPVALAFQASVDPEFTQDWLRMLRSANVVCLIGNEAIPSLLTEKLFGSKTVHIATPSSQSFSRFNVIEQQARNLLGSLPKNEYAIIITSMGCSGRPLQSLLYEDFVSGGQHRFFFFDFGSLMDALMGADTRAWISLSKFDAPSFLREI